jgi:hypothetical protein
MLRYLFTNRIYKGDYAYAKHDLSSGGFKQLPPEKWLIRKSAFAGIIPEKQMDQSQRDGSGRNKAPCWLGNAKSPTSSSSQRD